MLAADDPDAVPPTGSHAPRRGRAPLNGDDAMLLRRLVRAQLRLLEELNAPYGEQAKAELAPVIRAPKDVYELLRAEMSPLEHEQLRVLLLDTRHRVMDVVMLYQGTVNQANARIAELFREAVRSNATAIVITHNHPSGDPSPSADDIRFTREAAKAAELLEITLVDHIVIGRGSFVSMKERGAL
jgi:DNA repair protein RadC